MGIELRNKAITTGWFHLVSSMYCVRLKMTNTEQIMPAMAQNIPIFKSDMDRHDKAANDPNNTAKKVSVFPRLICYLFTKISVTTGVAFTRPASLMFCR